MTSAAPETPTRQTISRQASTTTTASTIPSSGVSSSGGGITTPGGSERKKRNRNLLRNYYGLGGEKKTGDPLDIDSPDSFNADMYFNQLNSTFSLPDLLKRENDLINEIRELDGERQSLVYNHHHELIEASDTIRKMRSRALALDGSLESLRVSFESISQLSESLSSSTSYDDTSLSPTTPRASSSTRRLPSPMLQTPTRLHSLPEDGPDSPTRPSASSSFSKRKNEGSQEKPEFDPLVHLPAILALPLLLRNAERSKAIGLWGQWEPALRSWEEEGVLGIKEVGMECREALKLARNSSQ